MINLDRHLAKNNILQWRAGMMRACVRHKSSLLVALFLFFLTTYGDSIAFGPAGEYWLNPLYYVVKLLTLMLFVGMSQLVPKLIGMYLNNDTVRVFMNYFLVYLGVMFVLWIAIFPGNFTGYDEPYVLEGARRLDIGYTWHHILTVLWYAIGLSIFPSIATITFLQFTAVSVLIAFATTLISKNIGKTEGNVLFAVLFAPSILFYSQLPHRLSAYAFLEMLLFAVISILYLRRRKIHVIESVALGILLGLVSAYRTESIIFLLLIPISFILLFIRSKLMTWRIFTTFIVMSVSVFTGLYVLQNINQGEKTRYQVTGIIEPLSSILVGGDYQYTDKQHVKQIVDEAIDYDRLVAGEGANAVYWSRPDRSLSQSELSDLKSITVQLVLQNPAKFLKGCIKSFMKSNSTWPNIPVELNPPGPGMNPAVIDGLVLSSPLSESVRKNVLNAISAVRFDRSGYTPASVLMYNSIPIIIGLICMAVYMVRRNEPLFILLVILLSKNALIFITAPMPWFFYYFPLQLTGLVLILIYVLFMRSGESKLYKKRLDDRKHEPWYRFGS